MVRETSLGPADAGDDRLWTAADLARFLGYAESTVVRMATGEPHKLPPRVSTLRKPRWVPSVCRRWAADNNKAASGGVKVGRPRRQQVAL